MGEINVMVSDLLIDSNFEKPYPGEIEFHYEGAYGGLVISTALFYLKLFLTGAQHWSEMFEDANGKNQSPIDIQTANAKYHWQLKDHPIVVHYEEGTKLKNTGHSFQIYFDHENNSCKLSSFLQFG